MSKAAGRMPVRSTGWLEDNLADPGLRIYDCTAYLLPDPETVFRVRSGRDEWARTHIPGANHIDIERDISDPDSPLRFTMPKRENFAAAMAALGVTNGSEVVLYSATHYMWATRVLWMLQDIGFTNAFILDGGLPKWLREGRPVTSETRPYPPGELAVRSASAHFVGKAAVLSAIGGSGAALVNALPPGQFRGDPAETNHGRLGRIASSINIPANSLLDPEEGVLQQVSEIADITAAAGLSRDQPVICYCGGGVSATCVAIALQACGYDDVSVYDGSMNEWAQDPDLPMETG
ncbi:MAG: sulfurtransferase [Rhizobiaceae bacterium]|nr:sulfurtransferase [Rhizobiaceae bacterium]